MRRILLMMLLAVSGSDAMADWVKVGSNESDTLFADPTTIIKTANKVKIQTLYNFKAPLKTGSGTCLSAVAQIEYDCSTKQSRTLFFAFHSKSMGKGAKIFLDHETRQWEPARPGSTRETFWRFTCEKSLGK